MMWIERIHTFDVFGEGKELEGGNRNSSIVLRSQILVRRHEICFGPSTRSGLIETSYEILA